MSAPKWTPAQRAAIEDRGGTLLVSAAAGSGKTAVLVERAVRLITDAAHPVAADRLLIVTFTRAAAEELRGRIAVRLAAEAAAHPESAYLRRQRLLLGRANICTIDAFCMQLLKRYFAELGLPPDFELADDAKAYTLRQNALSAVLRGVGDSRTPLLIIGVATVVNTVLDLWFVAGLGMGTAGAALATTAAQAVSFGMALVLVARRTGLLQPKLSFFRMHGALLRLILRLGIPSALQMTIAGFSWLVVTFLVNQYGVDVSAGNGVAIKIKDICQLFISAMASGATTMIAQNLGASKFERAKDVMYTAMKITCAMAAAMIVLVELFAPQMAAVFTNEAAVRDAAVLNLRIEILGQIFYAVFMVYHALAIGAGHSTFAMLSSFANCIVFRVVLSLLFNHLWGIYGLYAACAVAPSISVPLGWLYTRSGVWRRSLAKTEK